MATQDVVLSQHQHQHQHELIESLVDFGRYQNASDVLRKALRLLERQETEDSARVAALRAAADTGWADLASGRYVDIDDDDFDEVIGQLGTRSTIPGRSVD